MSPSVFISMLRYMLRRTPHSMIHYVIYSFIPFILIFNISAAALSTSLAVASPLKPQLILSSIYPNHLIVKNLIRDISDLQAELIAPSSLSCPHDYELTPENIKSLLRAQILVVNGGGMESYLNQLIKSVQPQNPNLAIISSTQGLPLIKEISKSSNHFTHFNPHAWVSISLYIKQVEIVSEELQKKFPHLAASVAANQAKYISKLKTLNQQLFELQKKTTKKKQSWVTFHESFLYLAKDLGIELIASMEREPGSEPNPKEFARWVEILKKHPHATLVLEPQYPQKLIQTLQKELGQKMNKILVLDPVSSSFDTNRNKNGSDVTGNPDHLDHYVRSMENNLIQISKSLE